MAVTAKGHTVRMTATADILNWATMQATAGPAGVYRVRANALAIVAGATPTATVITNGGTSGVVIYSATPTASTTTWLAWSSPQELDDLEFTTAGTNVVLVVFLA